MCWCGGGRASFRAADSVPGYTEADVRRLEARVQRVANPPPPREVVHPPLPVMKHECPQCADGYHHGIYQAGPYRLCGCLNCEAIVVG